MSQVRTCLWFDGQAEDAARFYVSVVPNSKIESVFRPEPEGPALVVEFTLDGVPYQGLNGGPQFPLSEAVSIVVLTEDQEETDAFWARLTEGGEESRCGWLKDRFGLSWQIVPRPVLKLMSSGDPETSARVMKALHPMTKIDIATLEAAARG